MATAVVTAPVQQLLGLEAEAARSEEPVVRTLRDAGLFGIYTTVLIRPTVRPGTDLRGFNYGLGYYLDGAILNATKLETNLRVANQYVDEGFYAEQCGWRIPRLALGRYQSDGQDYRVTTADMIEIVSKMRVCLYVGGEKPFIEMLPAGRATVAYPPSLVLPRVADLATFETPRDEVAGKPTPVALQKPEADDLGSWGQTTEPWSFRLPVGRVEKLLLVVDFPIAAPKLSRVVPLIFILDGTRIRGVC